MFTPSFSSTSAAPDLDETARLPCLATGTPPPAKTNAVAVDMLKEPLASPPVPTISTAPAGASTATIKLFIAETAPAISSAVSPLAFSATQESRELDLGNAALHDAKEGFARLLLGQGRARACLLEMRAECIREIEHLEASPAYSDVSGVPSPRRHSRAGGNLFLM